MVALDIDGRRQFFLHGVGNNALRRMLLHFVAPSPFLNVVVMSAPVSKMVCKNGGHYRGRRQLRRMRAEVGPAQPVRCRGSRPSIIFAA